VQLRRNTEEDDIRPEGWLGEFLESQVWVGAIQLSKQLFDLAEQAHAKTDESMGG
jgi:hypothetical protein